MFAKFTPHRFLGMVPSLVSKAAPLMTKLQLKNHRKLAA